MSDKFLTINQAATRLGVSAKTLRRWEEQGIISAHRTIGNQRRFAIEDIEKLERQSISINEAANLIGVSAETLRRWEEKGIISSTRTAGNQRRFALDDIEKLQAKNYPLEKIVAAEPAAPLFEIPNISEPVIVERPQLFVPIDLETPKEAVKETVHKSVKTDPKVFFLHHMKQIPTRVAVVALSVFGGLMMLGGAYWAFGGNQSHSTDQLAKATSTENVLAESTTKQDFALRVNIPAEFMSTASVAGTLTAPNVVYTLIAGNNVSISGDPQNPVISALADAVTSLQGQSGDLTFEEGSGISIDDLTITNDDRGSAQKIFGNIKVGSDTISAASNTDTVEFSAGTGITLAADTTNKKITITGASQTSGWTDDGTTIRLTTSTDSVGIGTTTPSTTLHVIGTGTFSSDLTLGSSLLLGGDTLSDLTGTDTGLEVTGGTLSLITSCADNELLKYTGAGGWECASDAGAGAAVAGTGAQNQIAYWTNATTIAGDNDFYWDSTNERLGIGTSGAPEGKFHVNGTATGKALAILNQTGDQDILTASASGTTVFNLSNTGALGIEGTLSDLSGTVLEINDDLKVTGNDIIDSGDTTRIALGATTTLTNTNLTLSGTTTLDATSLTAINGGLTAINFTEFDVSAANGGIDINDDGNAGHITIEGTRLDLDSLEFVTSGLITTTGANDLTLTSTGGNLFLSSGTALNAGGGAASSFNFFADAVTGADGTILGSDNDLYIEDNLEVDGQTRFGNLTYTWPTSIAANDYVLQTQTDGTLAWVNTAGFGTNYWDQLNGVLTPKIETQDLLLGSAATTSAKFAFTNVNSGVPTASIGAITTNNALSLDATGNIFTTNKQTLTLGSASTGDIAIGNTGFTTCTALETVSGILTCGVDESGSSNWDVSTANGTITPKLASVVDFLLGGTSTSSAKFAVTGINDSATPFASVSAVAAGTGVNIGGDGSIQSLLNANLTLGGNTTGQIILSDLAVANAGLTISSFTNDGGVVFANASGVLSQTTAGSSSQCLIGGTTPSWADCGGAAGDDWSFLNGALSPKIASVADLLLGSQATASAKFAFTNVNSGVPTASIGAITTNNALSLDATGNIFTTNKQTLTLGSASTGDIVIGNNGFTTCTALETIAGVLTCGSDDAGTGGDGSSNWVLNTTTGVLSPINNTLDVLIGGTSTASAKFAVLNIAGSLTPVASVSSGLNGTATFLSASGQLQTANNQSLTLGGGDTGNIVLGNSSLASCTALETISGVLTCGSDSEGTDTNFWQLSQGAISPFSETLDVLIGSTATTSAQFAVTGIANGTPVATLSAISNSTGLSLNASQARLQSLNLGTLTIGGDTTGNIVLDSGSDLISLSDPTTAESTFTTTGTLTANGTFDANGIVTLGDGDDAVTIDSNALLLQTTGAGSDITLNAVDQIILSDFANCSALTTVSNNLTCGTADGASNWDVTNGAISPKLASTLDLLIGGTSTSSAKFAFTNVNSGIPTASISAITSQNAISLDASGNISTTNEQSLTLGSASTGDINFTIGTGNNLRINGAAGTTALSPSCVIVTNGIVTDTGTCGAGAGGSNWDVANGTITPKLTSTLDFLLGGSTTSSAKFAVININSGTPIASVSALGSGGVYLSAAGTLATTAKQSLTLGDSNTGDLMLGTETTARNIFIGNSTGSTPLVIESGTGGINFGDTANVKTIDIGGVTNSGTDTIRIATNNTAADIIEIGNNHPSTTLSLTGGNDWSIDSAGLGTFSQVTIDSLSLDGTTLSSSADLILNAAGDDISSNDRLTLGSLTPTTLATLDVRALSGTLAVATVSGQSSFAALVVDNSGVGDIFTASASGRSRLTLTNAGELRFYDADTSNYTGFKTPTDITSNAVYTLPTALPVSNNYVLIAQTDGSLSWTDAGSLPSVNFWDRNNGVLSPKNAESNDLLLGGTATNAAEFAITGISAGTPVATLSAISNSTGLSLNASEARLQSLNMGTLTIGGQTTGNLSFLPQNGAGFSTFNGKLGVNTTNLLGTLDVRASSGTLAIASISGSTAQAALIVDNSGVGDLFTASTGGVPKFTIQNNGTLVSSHYTTPGGIFYGTSNGAFALSAGGSTGQVLQLNGSNIPVWVDTGGTLNFWQRNLGAVAPFNITDDLLIGGSSTSSARFAFINAVGPGTPTASLSAGLAGGAFLNATGSLQTTAYQTLSLGGGDTGDITISTKGGQGGAGALRINGLTGANSASLTCVSVEDGIVTATGGCGAGAGGSVWTVGEATGVIYPQNPTLDLLIGGTSTASAKFAIINVAGSLNPIASLSAGTTGGSFLTAGGNLGTTANQTLSFGGATTGNLVFNPVNGTGFSTFNGRLGVNTGTPLANLDVRGNLGTIPVASLSGNTSVAGLIVDNSGTGDLFTASSSGLPRFVVTNYGYVGINTTTPREELEVKSTSSSNGFVQISANGGTNDPAYGFRWNSGSTDRLETVTFDKFQSGYGDGDTFVFSDDLAVQGNLFVTGNTGTIAVASVSGRSTFAGLIVDNSGTGDLFTASSSGLSRFTIKQNGDLQIGNLTYTFPSALGTDYILQTDANGILSWIDPGDLPNTNNWLINAGSIAPKTASVLDLLIGGTATTSAKFAVLNVNGSTTPIASLSATTASGGTGNGIVLNANGSIQSLLNNTLTLGGDTTGYIAIDGTVITPSGDLILNPFDELVLADTKNLIIGGHPGNVDYNVISDSSNTNHGLDSDDDLFIEGSLEVDGAVYFDNATIDTALSQGFLIFPDSSGVLTQDTSNLFYDDTTNRLGIGLSSSLLGTLDVRGTADTLSVASISGKSNSFAAMVVDNRGTGDIFTASSSGLSRFVINNNGNVGIGTTLPSTKLHIVGGSDASMASATSGYLVLGSTTGTNLLMDDNEVIARNNGAIANLHLNTEGGGVYISNSAGTGTLNINTNSGNLATFDVRANLTNGSTIAVASVSANSNSFAGLVVDNRGTGDILTASRGGKTTFTIGYDRVQIGTGSATGAGGAEVPQLLGLDSKGSTGDPSGGRQGDMYYNTADDKFRCYQGTGWKDCIATSQSEYLRAERMGNQSGTEVDSSSDHIFFNVATGSGQAIFLNTTSGYAQGGSGTAGGRFTLAAGRTYRLSAQIMASFAAADGQATFSWYNVTTGSYIGSGAYVNATNRNDTTSSNDEVEAIITTTSATIVEVRWTIGLGALSTIYSGSIGTRAFIEVLSGAQEVSASEYLRAEMRTNQTANFTADTDRLKLDTVDAFSGTSISLNTTSTYGNGLGRFTLIAGKTYLMRASVSDVTFTDNTDLAHLGFRWYNVTGSSYLGSAGIVAETELVGFASDAGYSGYAEAIITPSTTTTIEVRINANGNNGITSIGNSAVGRYANAYIEVLSDGTKVAQFTGATSAADGAIGYVPAPLAGQQGSVLLGNGAWSAQNYFTVGTDLTSPIASLGARTSYAGLVVDNRLGDLFAASSSGLNRFVITQAGRVGIGPTIPDGTDSRLTVSGSESTLHGKDAAIQITNTASGGTNWYIRSGATGTDTPTGGFSIGDDLGYRFSIDSDGDIGVNTNSASVQLQLHLSTGGELLLSRDDGTTALDELLGGIGFDSEDGNVPSNILHAATGIYGYAAEDHSTGDKGGYLTFNTSPIDQDDDTLNIERMRLTDAGRFGIATTTPLATLDVRGNSTNGGTVPIASVSGRTSFASLSVDNTLGDLFTASSSGLNRFVIKQNGQVGIGTANPTSLLDVNQSAGELRLRVGNYSTDDYSLGIANTDRHIALSSEQGTLRQALVFGDVNSATETVFGIGTSADSGSSWIPRFIIEQSGLIGIGTTSPLGTLDVRGASGTLPVASLSARTSFASLITDNSLGDLFTASASGLARFVIKNNGRIGIGTTTPDAILDIEAGAFSATKLFADFDYGNNRNLEITGPDTDDNTEPFYLNTNNAIGFKIDDIERMRLDDTGNFGIFSTSPLNALDVRSNTISGGTVAVASISGRTSFAGLAVDNSLGDLFTASSSGLTRFTITQAGHVLPGTDNLSDLGSSPSARFRSLYLGPGSLHVICRTTDGCVQNTDYALGINTTTGDFEIGVNGNASNSNSKLKIGQNGAVTLAGNLTVTGNLTAGGGSLSNWDVLSGAITPKLTSTLDLLIGGTSSSSARFHVYGSDRTGTTPVASISANSNSAAGLVVDNRGLGDILTASSGGQTRFTVNNNGNVSLDTTVYNNCTTLKTVNSVLTCSGEETGGGGTLGDIKMYSGSTAPAGWAVADGTAVSRTTYAELFAIVGTTYGTGDGSTTFNLPDLRSRVAVGAGTGTKVMTFSSRSSNTITVTGVDNISDNENQTGTAVTYASTGTNIGGLSAGTYYLVRVTNTSFQLATSRANAVAGSVVTLSSDGSGTRTFTITVGTKTLGNTGGEEAHSLTQAEMPAHTHTVSGTSSTDGAHTHGVEYDFDGGGGSSVYTVHVGACGCSGTEQTTSSGSHSHTVSGTAASTGSSGAANTLQPFTVVNYIIKISSTSNSDAIWTASGGTIFSTNITRDLLIGGVSSGSARFHVYGSTALAGTTPVASVSGNTSLGAFIIDNRVGDLFAASSSGLNRFVISQKGNVGIGITAPAAMLHISQNHDYETGLRIDSNADGFNSHAFQIRSPEDTTDVLYSGENRMFQVNAGSTFWNNPAMFIQAKAGSLTSLNIGSLKTDVFKGTASVASIAAQTSFATLVVDNSGSGDLFAASSSGLQKFTITNSGNVRIGNRNDATNISPRPYSGLEVLSTRNVFDNMADNNNYHMMLWNTDGTTGAGTGIAFANTADSTNIGASIVFERTGAQSQGELQFYTKASTTQGVEPVHAMTITNAQNVDINGNLTIDIDSTDSTFAVCHATNGVATEQTLTDCNGSATDIAEFYPSVEDAEPGDLMTLISTTSGDQKYKAIKSTSPNDQNLIGVVSTIPTGPNGDPMGDGTITDEEHPQAIGIAGRVVIKVSLENGIIEANDYLTSSSIPGVAMKATTEGRVIGRALERYDGSLQVSEGSRLQEYYRKEANITTGSEPKDPPLGIGKVLMTTTPTWYNPDIRLTSTGNISIFEKVGAPEIEGTTLFGVKDANDIETTRNGVFANAVVGNLRTGSLEVQNLTLGGTNINNTLIGLSNFASASANFTAPMADLQKAVLSLSDRIASVEAKIDLMTSASSVQFGMNGASGSAMYNFNFAGFSASTSAELSLDKVDINEATVGTLSVLSDTLLSDVGITGKLNIGLLSVSGLQENCYSTLTTEAGSCAVINTNGGILKLQSNGLNGIDIMNGQMTIDTDGNVRTTGEVTASKFNVDTTNVLSASLGEAVIPVGQTKVVIQTKAVTEDSAIFVTSKTKTAQPLSVTAQEDGRSFTVEINSPDSISIKFNWWIVN